MKKILCLTLLLAALASPGRGQVRGASLPPFAMSELRVLEETYAVLDAVADKVWPGWTGYRGWPFQFTFENGLRVLVGHPNPPKEFEVVEGVQIGGNAVAVDRTHETPLLVKPPFVGGGGLLPFGSTASGARVEIIDIRLSMPRPKTQSTAPAAEGSEAPGTEDKILVYLHELFHGFQSTFTPARVGNLLYNADLDYAVWSNVEGLALDRAYAETAAGAATERLKDFLVARALKRRSMTELQQRQESSDDAMEGTATYAMVRALEVIKAGGFRPKLTSADDPEYHGFANVDALIGRYRKQLREDAPRHADPKAKCYQYGCFQALLAERLFPGWQARVQKGEFIDAILAANAPISDAERVTIEQRLKGGYPVAEVRADAAKFIDARDAAWSLVKSRSGRTYIIDLKGTGTYPPPPPESAVKYRLGLITLFPSGFPGLKLDEIEISKTAVPAMSDQLYYVKVVDTEAATRKQAYTVTGMKQADGTYLDAVVTTPVFTLKAPKVRIHETATRVKIQVLARVAARPTT